MKTKFADADGKLDPIYSFYSGLLCGIPSALVVVWSLLYRHLSTMRGLKWLSTKKKEKDQLRWQGGFWDNTDWKSFILAFGQL